MRIDAHRALELLRNAVADTQRAHYESGWYEATPISLAEHESQIVKDHFAKLEADKNRAVAECNQGFARLILLLDELE